MTQKMVDNVAKAPPKVADGPQPIIARPRFTTKPTGEVPVAPKPAEKAAEPPRKRGRPRLQPMPPEEPPAPKSKIIAMKMAETKGDELPVVVDGAVAQSVERMAGIGLTRKDIKHILQLSEREMQAYSEAISFGVSKANFKVANALFAAASDQNHRKFSQCAIFWAKARMGWRDDPAAADAPPPVAPEDEGPSELEISRSFESLMDRYRPAPKAAGG